MSAVRRSYTADSLSLRSRSDGDLRYSSLIDPALKITDKQIEETNTNNGALSLFRFISKDDQKCISSSGSMEVAVGIHNVIVKVRQVSELFNGSFDSLG